MNSLYWMLCCQVSAFFLVAVTYVCSKRTSNRFVLASTLMIILPFLLITVWDITTDEAVKTGQYFESLYIKTEFYVTYGLSLGTVITGILLLNVALLSIRICLSFRCFSRRPYTYASFKMEDEFTPEKMQPGSQFESKANMPGFQCEVHVSSESSRFFPSGQAFLVEEGLLTAAHVVTDVDSIMLVKGGVEILVKPEDFTRLDGDLALLKVPQQMVQKLGLSQAKLSQYGIGVKSGLMAQVYSFGRQSFGFVDKYDQFGYCSYGGSTVKGFSGAPYYVNKMVYGMHLGGDVCNLGYEAAYIKSVLKPTASIVRNQESSEDWLIDQARQNPEDLFYERSPYDPDEYRVRLNGRYHMVQREVMDLIKDTAKPRKRVDIRYDFESNKSPTIEVDEEVPLAPRTALTFEDSGNLFRAPAVDAGARGKASVQVNAPRKETQILNQTDLSFHPNLANLDTESLRSMLAQPRGASQSISKGKRKTIRLLQAQKEIERLSKLLNPTSVGAQTSAQLVT